VLVGGKSVAMTLQLPGQGAFTESLTTAELAKGKRVGGVIPATEGLSRLLAPLLQQDRDRQGEAEGRRSRSPRRPDRRFRSIATAMHGTAALGKAIGTDLAWSPDRCSGCEGAEAEHPKATAVR
jgi:hypothetical protein